MPDSRPGPYILIMIELLGSGKDVIADYYRPHTREGAQW